MACGTDEKANVVLLLSMIAPCVICSCEINANDGIGNKKSACIDFVVMVEDKVSGMVFHYVCCK